jgi:5-methylcytosine-specific restriction endonuclease McrA
MSQIKARWKEARDQALARDNYQCTQCGSTEELEVHHLKPSGGIKLDNLQTLCQKCHEKTSSYGVARKPKQDGK